MRRHIGHWLRDLADRRSSGTSRCFNPDASSRRRISISESIFHSHLVDANLIYVSLAGNSWKPRASVSTRKLDRVADERTTLLSPGICRPTLGKGQQQDGWHSRSSFWASWRSLSRVDSRVGSRCQEAPGRTRRHAAVRVVPSQRLFRWPIPRLATEVLFMLVYPPPAQDLPSEVAKQMFRLLPSTACAGGPLERYFQRGFMRLCP